MLYVPLAELGGRVLMRKPVGYTVGLSDPESDRFVSVRSRTTPGPRPALDDHNRESVFVWFLSTAPDEALTTIEDHPISKDRSLGALGPSPSMSQSPIRSMNGDSEGRRSTPTNEAATFCFNGIVVVA